MASCDVKNKGVDGFRLRVMVMVGLGRRMRPAHLALAARGGAGRSAGLSSTLRNADDEPLCNDAPPLPAGFPNTAKDP